MGHSGTVPGAIKAQDLAEALQLLQKRLAKNNYATDRENDEDEVEIGLSKRAIPLIKMLEYSIRDNCDILWDV